MKKIKATYKDIPTYHNVYRYQKYNKYGYVYVLSDKLTNEDKTNLMNKYSNIELMLIQSEYVAESVKNGIFIYSVK